MDRARLARTTLRLALAVLLGVHPATRVLRHTVPDLGAFLAAKGFPLALGLAWSITAFEAAGSLLLALGRGVRPVCAGFAVILVSGIILVHAPEGWFVVGGGRNGVEYSLSLLAGLASLFIGEGAGAGPVRDGA